MTVTLADFDKPYRESICNMHHQLEESFHAITAGYVFDLSKTEITEAILARLKTLCSTQHLTKVFLGKRYQASVADYFVESVLFFLRLYLRACNSDLEAHSERQIRRRRSAMRPDISVWRGEEVVAAIECKTQLGWSRDAWERDYFARQQRLKTDFPNAEIYLLTLSEANWGGFQNHSALNSRFFSLLGKTWVAQYTDTAQVLTPIEGLFAQVAR